MGLTATLMPTLEELCILAKEFRQYRGGSMTITWDDTENDLYLRADEIAFRVQTWHPLGKVESLSARTLKVFLLQAYALQAAALLYIHRLKYPAGISEEADRIALAKACEILAHLSAPPEELRMSTLPAFVAACEMSTENDRATAISIFDGIYLSRKTATTLRTKEFCIRRVWHARDCGMDWNWMNLVQQYPWECVPI